MKRIFWGACYVLLAAWMAFDPFVKAPVQPDTVGDIFGYIAGVFILTLGWAQLRKPSDHPNW
jgi:hypothetical protein